MNQFYVYAHSKPDGTPFYVGKGRDRRAYDFFHRNAKHKELVSELGRENVIITVYENQSESDAFKTEIDLIANLKEFGFDLVNVCSGGQGSSGSKRTQEQVEKTRKHHIGKKRSSAVCERISASITGRKLSEQNKQKIADWHKSQEGVEWNERNKMRLWKNRKPTLMTCVEPDCQKQFETLWPSKAKYCCDACGQRGRKRENGIIPGPRRKVSGWAA